MLYGEAETDRFVLAKIGHFDVLQVTLIDQVVGGNGVAQKDISLVESHRVEGILVGRIGLDRGVGVVGPHFCHG
ncbi:hypothetical protein D3C78_1135280 [compost metagenome]